MSQSRLSSFFESLVNVGIGYLVAVAAQMAIFPLFGLHVAAVDHLLIGVFFTFVSVARSYCVRRLFVRLGGEG